ncbi:MFS transporter, partial [bacterium]|nr:MFS transporter [bacterium]
MLELLRKLPAFRNFWFAQAISQIGDRIHSLALIWLVYSFTGSSAYVGVVMIATTLPGIILGPFAGTFADRHDRKKIM